MRDINLAATPEERAYLAGLVDGEGCISIARVGRYHHCRVQVSNTDRKMLDWIYAHFGGSVYLAGDHRQERHGWKPSFNWIVTGRKADQVLNLVQPYLVIKIKQCKLALKFGQRRGHGKIKLTERELAVRERIKQDMHKLNARGASNG